MLNQLAEPKNRWGGEWTLEKLDILERYLDAYTTALKNKSFKLMYVDAFAGTGHVELVKYDLDATEFIQGSAVRAAHIDDRQFDRLVFVEKDPGRCAKLETLKEKHHRRDIRIENADANGFLRNLQPEPDWNQWRGVLFLDPFATEVEWSTIERIAGFNALDTWILFPTRAIVGMLPKSKRPDDIDPKWVDRLTTVFGDDSWRGLYREKQTLFGDVEYERTPGVTGLLDIYKNKLAQAFGNRFLRQSRTLKNSKNAPLFEFLFCVGSPRRNAIDLAQSIADHILKNL